MSMQISNLAALAAVLVLAGCKDQPVPTATELAHEDDALEMVQCAIGEGSRLGPDCTVERIDGEEAPVLIVRHADGGFQRFEQLEDGRGLRTADGADEANLTLDGDILIVDVADNQYRFPATVSGRNDSGE